MRLSNSGSCTPLVSIIIPNKDRIAKLHEAVNSVKEQSYSNLEIIIVDDSSPEIYDTLFSFYKNDDKVIFIKGDGKNDVSARFKGAVRSNGKYIFFLDCDDKWIINKVEFHVRMYETASISIPFITDEFVFGLNGPIIRAKMDVLKKKVYNDFYIIDRKSVTAQDILFGGIPSHSSSISITRNYLKLITPFDSVPFDSILFIRTFSKYPIGYISTPLTVLEGRNHENIRLSNNVRRLITEKVNIKYEQIKEFGRSYIPLLSIALFGRLSLLLLDDIRVNGTVNIYTLFIHIKQELRRYFYFINKIR